LGTSWLQETSTPVPWCEMPRTLQQVYSRACLDDSHRGGLAGLFVTVADAVCCFLLSKCKTCLEAGSFVDRFKFYVGTNNPSWLWNENNTNPLFVSVRRLRKYKKFRPSGVSWSCDSGGFTELSIFDKWVTPPGQYVEELYRITDEIGLMDWASPQDWMCEPHMIQKTGKSIDEHQRLTCENFLELQGLAPDLPIIPVLQGWAPDDYRVHLDMYLDYGVDLRDYPTVGMGSFCRRANVQGVKQLVEDLSAYGLKMHGFGLKKDGLKLFRNHLVSSDSMAWSFTARTAMWQAMKLGCETKYLCDRTDHKARNCGDCHRWAMMWADDVASTQQRM